MKNLGMSGLSALLFLQGNEIIVQTNDTTSLLNSLEKTSITLNSDPRILGDIISLNISGTKIPFDYWIITEEMARNSKINSRSIEIMIRDFEDSESFYKIFSGKNKKHKIVSDDYSFSRAVSLYEYAAKIETSLRKKILRKLSNQLIVPISYNSKSPDHVVSQYTSLEFFDKLLLSPATDGYFLEKILESNLDPSKIIEIRELTKKDELELSLSREDYEFYTKIRNSVMHFRVITFSETIKFLEFVSGFEMREFAKLYDYK